MAFDPKTVKTNDWGVLGGVAAIFIVSLIPSYVTFELGGVSFPGVPSGVNAWQSYATLGLLFLFAAGVIVTLRVFAIATLPEIGVGWSGYLLMLLAIATTVFAALNFRESGETAPWADRGASGAAGAPPNAPPPNAPPSNAPPSKAPPPTAPPPA